GVNVAADVGAAFPQVPLELVVARAPDVIVDAAMGTEAGGHELFANLASVPAVRDGRIVAFAPDALFRAGPRVAEAAAALGAALPGASGRGAGGGPLLAPPPPRGGGARARLRRAARRVGGGRGADRPGTREPVDGARTGWRPHAGLRDPLSCPPASRPAGRRRRRRARVLRGGAPGAPRQPARRPAPARGLRGGGGRRRHP